MNDSNVPEAAVASATDGSEVALDPFLVEVIRHGLTAAAEEMSLVVMRSARSPLLREAGDLSSTLTDRRGELVAQGRDIPLHLAVMAYTVKDFLREVPAERLRPGDAWILNLPEIGGNHLPDVKLIRPIFYEDELVAFSVSLAHWPDIGGAWPGSYYAAAMDSVQEGLRIPPMRLFTGAGVDREKLAFIMQNVRAPVEREGDVLAQMAATLSGERRVHELCETHGRRTLLRTIERLHDLSEAEMRDAIAGLPDGEYRGEDFVDEGGADGGPAAVRVTVGIAGDEMRFDFSETDDVVDHYLNTTPYVVRAASAYAARILSAREMQQNGGCLRPLSVVIRPGSLLDPGPNRPIVAGNHETANRIVDAIFRAFEEALPERVSAGGPTTVGGLLFSERKPDGSWKTLFEVHGGGEGARHDRDGGPATRVHLVNTMNTPIEVIESQYAVRIGHQRLRPGSGGAGAHRGGDGYVREYEVLAPEMMLTACVDRMVVPPYGMQGGGPGAPFRITHVRGGDGSEERLPGKLNRPVHRGDRIIIETSGGGGFGVPPGDGAS